MWVAYRRDLLEKRGLLEAYRKGEDWALRDVADSLEFYDQLFRLEEYHLVPVEPKGKRRNT